MQLPIQTYGCVIILNKHCPSNHCGYANDVCSKPMNGSRNLENALAMALLLHECFNFKRVYEKGKPNEGETTVREKQKTK